jgi:phenylalanyl-tRNA synthetase beta chain
MGVNMAVIAFDIRDFKKIDLPMETVERALIALGIEIEEKNDKEIRLNVTPNRPDLLDFVGIRRAVENFTEKRVPRENFYKIKNEPALTIEVEPGVKRVRPYIAGLVVKNADLSGNMLGYLINFTEKFADTYGRRRRKLAVGLHSLGAVKGNITYSAAEDERFVPLNSAREMSFAEIMREHDKGQEYAAAVRRKSARKALYPYIKDEEKILAMIPIINCDATKVTERTKDLFIDIAGTSLKTIRDAAALLACSFMYAGADVYPVNVVYQNGAEVTPELEYDEIKMRMNRVERTLGIDIEKQSVIGLANKMNYVAAQLGNSVMFYVPPFRLDVLNEQDVTEDIAIAFGYDRIQPLPVMGTAEGLASEEYELENRLAHLMTGLGYTEAVNSVLTNEKVQFENVNIDHKSVNYVRIEEAKTSNITMLRFALVQGLLQNLSDSKRERMPQRLFEIGRVFSMEGDRIKEGIQIAVVSEHSKANFAEIKAVFDQILGFLGKENCKIELFDMPGFLIEGRHAVVKEGDKVLGGFGEIHPKALNNFGLEEPVVAGGIDIVTQVKYDA